MFAIYRVFWVTRNKMRLLLTCLALLVLIDQPLSAETKKISNVRIWATLNGVRVVFDVNEPIKYRLDMLSDPYRLIIDIADTHLVDEPAQPNSSNKYIQRLRGTKRNNNDLRIVIDLKKFSRAKSFQLKPNRQYGYRLIVDIFSVKAEIAAKEKAMKLKVFASKMKDVIIAIDAGHGGEDPGASGPGGTYEKNVTLQIAKVLAKQINKQRGMRAALIRKGDYFMHLRKRITKVRQYKADMLISLHVDAFKDPTVYGSSVYVLSKKGASSEHAKWLAERENAADLIGGVSLESRDDALASVLLDLSQTASLEASIDIAEKVLAGMKRIGKLHKPKVEAAAFTVLKSPDIPSILIEIAYISNPQEERNLRNPAYQRKVSNVIVNSLRSYFNEYASEETLLASLASKKYVIARGDTLSEIALWYDVSVRRLKNVNRLDSDLVRVGQVLKIPVTDG